MRESTAWIIGGVAAVLPVAGLLIWLNIDGKAGPINIPLLPEHPASPSHARLQVLERPGQWRMVSTATGVGLTNSVQVSGTLHAYWGLNGHALILEAETTNTDGGLLYDLTVKHFNDKGPFYHYTLIQDDGYVRGLIGDWDENRGVLNWRTVYLPGAPASVTQRMVEQLVSNTERKTRVEIVNGDQVELSAQVDLEWQEEIKQAPYVQPATPELARLGSAGVWQEVESGTEDGRPVTNRINGRSRWTRGGRALLYEGVIDNNGVGVYFMWVKTYDRVRGLYRMVYFFKDGPVDHFVGNWNEAKKQITWKSIQPPGNRVIHETFVSPDHRTWRVEFFNDQGVRLSNTDGESRLRE